jgi:DNA (cytosine-5)-methyltransferase 1
MANFEIVGATEIDKWACETFEANHPGVFVHQGDIRKISDAQIKTLFGSLKPDILVGGPPCQGFSIANSTRKDPKDPRNTLFKEFVRFGKILKPEVMVMENVPNLLKTKTKDGVLVINIITDSFKELGYKVYFTVLSAASFGVPQIRNRLFILASREDLHNPFPKPTHEIGVEDKLNLGSNLRPTPTLWEAISDLPALAAGEGAEQMPYEKPPITPYQAWARQESELLLNHKAMNHTKRMVERFEAMTFGQSGSDVPLHLKPKKRNSIEIAENPYDQNNRRLYPNRPCHTISASFYANFVHPYQNRNFTAREGARIQSFPDTYVFCGKPTVVSHKLLAREGRMEEKFLCQYSQIGNSVPPLLSKAVADNLMEQIG